MAYCRQCGALIDEAAQFCPDCGASQAGAQTTRVVNQDVEDNRFMAILSYIGPLAFVPYFAAKQSPFAQYHAVRGLNLFILEAVFGVAASLITGIFTLLLHVLGALLGWILNLGWLGFLALSIIGIVNVCNGEKKELPIVSGIRFIRR